MSVNKFAQTIEMKFWNFLIPVMQDEGLLMKNLNLIKHAVDKKVLYLIVLVFIWAKIGFAAGMLTGRLLWMMQIP